MMTQQMDKAQLIKKYEADKIALLALFAMGLLIARQITSSRYTGPLKAGRQVIAEIRRKGISSFYQNRQRQAYFLIRNERRRPVGFRLDVISDTAAGRMNVEMATFRYERGRLVRDRLMAFRSDDSFETFQWSAQAVGPAIRALTEVVLSEDGTITVKRSDQRRNPLSYKPPPTSMPKFLLDLVFTQMLESDYHKIIVETIDDKGLPVEVVVHRSEEAGPSDDGPIYRFNVDFEGVGGFSQQVYVDNEGRILRRLIEQDKVRLLERTDAKTILREFPERSNYILRSDEIMEQSTR
ncbi:MAG: hypothetical protein ACYTEL_12515 [Planctomycetota bacterium]|jgi:hypothetical protein